MVTTKLKTKYYFMITSASSIVTLLTALGVCSPCRYVPVALAQDLPSINPQAPLEISSGMSDAELVDAYGQPSRKLEDKVSEQSTWYYGETVIFLSKGRVTAWSNASSRRNALASLGPGASRTSAASATEMRTARWDNAWTPPELDADTHTADEIISELGSK